MYEKRDYKVEINKHKYPKWASIYDVRKIFGLFAPSHFVLILCIVCPQIWGIF